MHLQILEWLVCFFQQFPSMAYRTAPYVSRDPQQNASAAPKPCSAWTVRSKVQMLDAPPEHSEGPLCSSWRSHHTVHFFSCKVQYYSHTPAPGNSCNRSEAVLPVKDQSLLTFNCSSGVSVQVLGLRKCKHERKVKLQHSGKNSQLAAGENAAELP